MSNILYIEVDDVIRIIKYHHMSGNDSKMALWIGRCCGWNDCGHFEGVDIEFNRLMAIVRQCDERK